MCTPEELAGKARMKVRDFGTYFEVPYTAAPVYTIQLPHPLVPANRLMVWHRDGEVVESTEFMVDERNGIVKLKTPADWPDGVGISGYYYEWFLDADLLYATSVIANQHYYNNDKDSDDIQAVECDAIATGGVAQAMWSLLAEFATDVDVSTPEGMSIPAHQRFQQMWQMATFWQEQYKSQAAMLGVGLDRIEQFWLRRVSYLTNRLVPIIKEREVDDPRPPQRVLPVIPDGTMPGDDIVYTPEPPGGISGTGWQTIMTSGSP